MTRKPYPTDVSDEEWAFVAPYLTLMSEAAPQREHSLREVFNGLRWMVRAGSGWRLMPHDLPPWAAVYQQTQRWMRASVFEAIVDDLRELLKIAGVKERAGNTYVTGLTSSRNFPLKNPPPNVRFKGGFSDAFVTKLNADGTGLIYSTFLGGSRQDEGGCGQN